MAIINDNDFPLLPSQEGKRHHRKRAHVNTKYTRSKGGLGASLNDLPDELILEILQYLQIGESSIYGLRTLLDLALTNRRFYRIVIEKIYKRYGSYLREPYKFLRTMILKPELADLVHDMDISFGLLLGKRHTPTAQDKKIVKEGLRALATPGWKDWAADCNAKQNSAEAVYKAILFYTRNMKSLQFQGEIHAIDWFDVFGNTTAGILSDRAHGFQHLRSVSIENSSASIIQLAPLFRLQSLRTLQTRRIDCWTVSEEVAPRLQRLIPQACNNLESLILDESFYPKSILSILLASSRNLKYFKYDMTEEDNAEVPLPHDGTWISLSHALAYQNSSLEDIDVYSEHYREGSQDDVHLRDSLKDFSVLKCITCPLSKMASSGSDTFVERLPASLLKLRTYIRKYTDDPDCIEALEHMIVNYQSHTPQLQEIIVAAPPSTGETYNWLKYDWSRLVQLSSKTGLSFKVDCQGDGSDDDFNSNWGGVQSVSSPSSDEVDLYSDDE